MKITTNELESSNVSFEAENLWIKNESPWPRLKINIKEILCFMLKMYEHKLDSDLWEKDIFSFRKFLHLIE